jgi:hypothetical protein
MNDRLWFFSHSRSIASETLTYGCKFIRPAISDAPTKTRDLLLLLLTAGSRVAVGMPLTSTFVSRFSERLRHGNERREAASRESLEEQRMGANKVELEVMGLVDIET